METSKSPHPDPWPEPDFKRLFEAAPGTFLVLLPNDPVFTIVAVSDALVPLTGQVKADFLGKGIFQAFPENRDEADSTGVHNLRASLRRTIATRRPDSLPVQRYDVERPASEGGGFRERYWTVCNHPLLGADGNVELILHSTTEITDQILTERREQAAARELRNSEERFRQLTETSGFSLVTTDAEGRLTYIDPTLLRRLGYTHEEAAGGNLRSDRLTPGEFAELDSEAAGQLAAGGRPAPYEKAFVAKDGSRVPVLVVASHLEVVKGNPLVASVIVDLTERKRSQADAFLVRLDDATRKLSDPGEITQTASRLLAEHLNVNRCAYSNVESDEDTLNLTEDFSRGVESFVGRYRISLFGAECARLLREGRPYVVDDVETDLRTVGVREAYRAGEVRALICVPLHKAGRLAAAMAVHQRTPRRWKQEEVDLLLSVSSRCWESIERATVTRALQESERLLRLAQAAGRVGSFEWLIKEDRVTWTPEHEDLYGLAALSFEGRVSDWTRRLVPTDAGRVLREIKDALASREPECTYEFRAVLPDGAERWIRGHAQIFYDESGTPERMVGVNIDIDALKRTEAHLRQQWHTFDVALSNTPDFTYTFDLDGRFTYVNRALLALWRKTLEEATGKNFLELGYPEELAHKLEHQLREVVEGRQPVRDHTPFTGPDGETRNYEYIFVPVFGENGRVEAIAGSTRDMTERSRAEALVQDDRRRWRELLAQAPAAIAVLRGPEHRFDWVNAGCIALLGKPAEALLGEPVHKVLSGTAPPEYADLFDSVYRTGEPRMAREACIMLDRLGTGEMQQLFLNAVCLPTHDSDGRIDGTFVHATDVTDLVTARQRVEQSERQFRTLAETIPHLAWMADETGKVIWFNKRWYDYTGTTSEQLQTADWGKLLVPDSLPEILDWWSAAFRSGEPAEMIFPLRGADGEYRTFLTRIAPVRDLQGNVVRWFGTNTDITDQRRTEEELRRINRELEEFAYVASHDLQEPLRMVNLYTQLILKRMPTRDEGLQQHADMVRRGVIRMEALLRDLLTFSRTVHTEPLPVSMADLSAAFGEAISVLKGLIAETGAEIVLHSALPEVRGDTAQLAHVFQNLLSNAMKYRRLDETPRIDIAAEQTDGYWVISVKDNGIGFEQEHAERIFGLFRRLHKDQYPGTGLGLAICLRIVERCGGRIWAEGHPGEGAVFRFSLPAA